MPIIIGVVVGNVLPGQTGLFEAMVYIFLIALMYSLMLGVDPGQVRGSFNNIRFFKVALLMNFVFVPLLAYGLATLFLIQHPAIFVGFILYMVVPCTDWFLMFTNMAKGDTALGVALLPVNLLVQIILLPVYLYLFAGHIAPFAIDSLLETMGVFIVLPFILATLTRRIMANMRSVEWRDGILDASLANLQTGTLIIIIFAMFAGQADVIVDNIGPLSILLVPVLLFFIIIFISSQLVSLKTKLTYGECALLTCTTTARNSPLGLAMAVGLFPGQPLIQVALIIPVVLELPILILVVKGLHKVADVLYR